MIKVNNNNAIKISWYNSYSLVLQFYNTFVVLQKGKAVLQIRKENSTLTK